MATAKRRWIRHGRSHAPSVVAKTTSRDDGILEVRAPFPGFFRGGPGPGSLVPPNTLVGELELLGTLYEVCSDEQAHGLVVGEIPAVRSARRAVEHGEALLLLDPSEAAVHAAELEAERERDQHTGLVFSAPSSGRFYSRSSPDKPAFVTVGDVIEEGAPVALLEVMKTFHRIAYGGAGLPHRARVLAILANDGADLEVGDAILEIEQA